MLICIDDVEAVIQAELQAQSASQTPPPTRLVGVPPSRGRGGNQTPRSESVFITGSQPLPSPSSSFGSSSHLDRWAFGMSKIEGAEAASGPGSVGSASKVKAVVGDEPDASASEASANNEAGNGPGTGTGDGEGKRADSAEDTAERIGNVTLDSSPFGEKTRAGAGNKAKAKAAGRAGPSLLSQQAPGPAQPQASTSASAPPPPP